MCGMSNAYISMLENNKNPKTGLPVVPSLTAIKNVANAIGVPLNDVLEMMGDVPVSLSSDEEQVQSPTTCGGDVLASDIGRRIRDLRKQRGMSQEELAIKLGYESKSSINKIEQGIQDIPRRKIEAFARVLDVTPAYLMGWGDEDELAQPLLAELAEKVRKRRMELGLTQEELALKMGYKSRVSVNKIERGRPVSYKIIYRLSQALGVTPGYLMGWEDEQPQPLPANSIPVKRVQVPMLGGIAAGEPILAEQQYDAYVEADADLDCTYALRVDGDSMEPTVRYGDIVFIRQQEDVDDGRIAAVLVDDSATLKRVYHIPNGLQLLSDNAAKYPPRAVTFEDYDTIRILGLAVAFKRNL